MQQAKQQELMIKPQSDQKMLHTPAEHLDPHWEPHKFLDLDLETHRSRTRFNMVAERMVLLRGLRELG